MPEVPARPSSVTGRHAPAPASEVSLDTAELTIAGLVATGWSNADIATALSLPRDVAQASVAKVIAVTGAGSRLAVTPARIHELTRRNGPGDTHNTRQ